MLEACNYFPFNECQVFNEMSRVFSLSFPLKTMVLFVVTCSISSVDFTWCFHVGWKSNGGRNGRIPRC